MEIVLNVCYGGFTLSERAINALLKRRPALLKKYDKVDLSKTARPSFAKWRMIS